MFAADQSSDFTYYLNTEKLIYLLGDILQAYPKLVATLIPLTVTVSDTTSPFLSYLIRTIIPFRYSLKIRNQKMLLYHPGTSQSVIADLFQNWVKACVKLLRALMFKQVFKQLNSPVAELYNEIFLDNNNAIIKARKIIIKEIRDILYEQLKNSWCEDAIAMTWIRSSAMITMQLLRERPKMPFASINCVEIARLVISEKNSFVKLFSEAVKRIDLSFKRAESLYNLLLAPLELLTKYQLNFLLKSNKSQELSEVNIELYPENDLLEGNSDLSQGNSEEEQEENEQDIDDQSSGSEIGENHPQQDDIVIERRNIEAFVAEDFEEEEDEEEVDDEEEEVDEGEGEREVEGIERGRFRRIPLPDPRSQENIISERSLFELENPQPFLNYRSIFRDFDENMPGSMLLRDFEHDDLLQALLQRSRNIYRQEPPPPAEPVFQRIFPEASDNLRQLSIHYSEIAEEEPLFEEEDHNSEEIQNSEDEANPPLIPQIIPDQDIPQNPRENQSLVLPEGIDPSFLEALPDDIRNELIAQYQRPPRNEVINEEFLQALPPELRNEVLSQNRQPSRPAAEMDNATFIASLTPDLRREVLITANEEFLNTLPPDLVAEARLLQERVVQRDNYLGARQPQVKKKQTYEEDKTIIDLVADERLSASVVQAEDSLLEVLFKGLYLSSPINRDILSSLFLNLSVNSINRIKIIDALITLLLHFDSTSEFPPKQLYGSDSFLANYSKVHAIVSLRILDILQTLVISNPKVSSDLISPLKHRLSLVKLLREEETLGFQDLISLMDQYLFRTSTSHLSPLISLISAIVNKLKTAIPALNQLAIDRLCSLLSFESLNDASVKTVVDMVTKLSQMESNKEQVVKALRYQIKIIGQEIIISLKRQEASHNGFKELQLLRICKVITGVSGVSEDIDFLWEPLTDALSIITSKENQTAILANPILGKLLPLIESFFISHYERSTSETFRLFTEKNCKTINLLIHQNPNLLKDTFNSLITRFPSLLEFENKRIYFKAEMQLLRPDRGYDSIRLNARRAEVFMDSFHQLKVRSPSEMHGKLRVQFVGEEGLDAGGLTREWFGLLSREMFNPNYALFVLSENGVSFQPNSLSSINKEHIQFFKFVGRIIGKALCDGQSLDVYFTRSFYKHILGQEVTYQDMEDLDVEFYKSLKALMEINLNESDLHEYYFAYDEEEFGRVAVKELIPEGKNKRVTEENKIEYIKLLCHLKMTKNIQEQIDAFKAGFHELVPIELISIFDSKELELLISGLPVIDLDDLKANTDYHNYTVDSPVIVWLWEILDEFSREERAEFLQFVTGSSKVPLEGFKALPGMGGFQKFQIHKSFASNERLPTAHTCMNQLDLPEYPTKEKLKNRLKYAISEGKEGFGFV